ncbi:MAG: RidA family protein [Bacteroidetes bacterium]|nr:RidA family protein [Bacteroidota bacterium]
MKTCKLLILVPLLLSSAMALAQTDTPLVKLINPATVAAPRGYSHAAEIDLGTCKMLILSGQVAFDNEGHLVGPGDYEKQTEQIFRNIKHIVESAGGKMDNLVKIGVYMRDVGQIQAFRTARDKFVNTKTPPASTLVEVSELFRDDVLIEIEATAIVPKH